MTQYIEKVSIELDLDTTKALKQLDVIRNSFEKLNTQSKQTGDTIKKALENSTKNADLQANKVTNSFLSAIQKIGNAFSGLFDKLEEEKTWKKINDRFSILYNRLEKIGDLFGNIFQKFAGYSSFGSLINKYTMGVLEQEWYNKALARRTASNSRSNGIYDFLKNGNDTYSNILLGPQTVKNNGVELRNNEYDKEILNQTNYLPGTRRWRISKFPMPFTEEDRQLAENYMESLAKIKYQFGIITGELAREIIPKVQKLLDTFSDLMANSAAFRNLLKTGFIVGGITKIADALKSLNGALGIIKLLFGSPKLTLGLAALGGTAVGAKWIYGKLKKFFENRKKNKSDNLSTIDNNWSTIDNNWSTIDNNWSTINNNWSTIDNNNYTPIPQKLLQNATNYNNSKNVSYNIENLNIRSDAKNVNSLLGDVRKNINRDRDNVFIMNNANYGVF